MSATINLARVREDRVYRDELRLRAQTDLFWLCYELLGYNKITEADHRAVTNHYVQKDPRIPIEHQDTIKNRLHLDPRGTYKAVHIDTLIPTPSGFKKIKDIHYGDKVYGADGRPCAVIGESPIYHNRPCFEIEFSSGEKVICDEDHQWETDTRRDRDRKKLRKTSCHSYPSVKTTAEIAETISWSGERNHRIKTCLPIKGREIKATVPPYVLGAWIGDGTKGISSITLPEKQKQDVFDEIQKEGEQIRRRNPPHEKTCNVGNLALRLEKLGCLQTKLIPDQYLWASRKQRLSLLQGLMDTDGSMSKSGCLFCTSKLALALQVRQLVGSLGMKSTHFEFEAKIGDKSYGTAYRVLFTAHRETPVFRMPRKLEKMKTRNALKSTLNGYRQIVAARVIESVPVKCISVDAADHLFLVGESFIPTHNSTINMGDCVQWIIGFPENAGLLLCGSLKLAQAFVGEVTQHFMKPKGVSGSEFQELFPEFCIPPSAVRVGSYCAPHRKTGRKDDTLMSGSMESAMSGWHFEWLKEDDIVDNRNSETPAGIEKTKKNRHINRKMLMPGGYRDTAGTRYDPFDAYGDDIAKARPGKIKILCRPALTLLTGDRLTSERFPEKDECTLTFPNLLDYEFLEESFEDDYSSFMTQYMNDAFGGKEVIFPVEEMTRSLVDEEQDPVQGPAQIVWRFSKSGTAAMKYAGAAVGRQAFGSMFIIEVLRGVYNPSAQARKVVELAKKHEVRTVQIIDSPGARHVEHHIHNYALEVGYKVALKWIEYDQDDAARDLRLKTIQPLIATGRVRFSDAIAPMTDLMRQFTNFGMVDENEIVECVARVCESLPKSLAAPGTEEDDDEEFEKSRERDLHDRVYGQGRYAEPNAAPTTEDVEAHEEPTLPTNPYGLEDVMPGLSG